LSRWRRGVAWSFLPQILILFLFIMPELRLPGAGGA
jgi:hypothetical protein